MENGKQQTWQEMFRDRIKAMFLLTAIGDALGMPVETMTMEKIVQEYGRIERYLDPPKDHKFHGQHMLSGMWTDDWQLTKVIVDSMIACKSINLDDIAQRHIAALNEDITGWGGSTTKAVKNLEEGIHWTKSGIPNAAGNGISMKVAPLGALLAIHLAKALDQGICFGGGGEDFHDFKDGFRSSMIEIARMTHQSRMAIASGLAQAYAICACLLCENEDFLDNFFSMAHEGCVFAEKLRFYDEINDKLSHQILKLRDSRDYERMSVEDLAAEYGGTGKARFYVYHSLPLSYAIFLHNPYSMETLFDAVAAGGDTDTNASMVGALLGARNGMKIFYDYKYLIEGLWKKEEVFETAEKFCDTFLSEQSE